MKNNYIPWHKSLWATVAALGDRLPHAMLLSGPTGVGKRRFAEALARSLLCEAPTDEGMACDRCSACRWFDAGSHPDFRHVRPESELEGEEGDGGGTGERKQGGTQIKIDQIRDLNDFVFVGGHRGGRRVIVIDPAEAMNAVAANSMLKLLEEPPSSVYFILILSSNGRLLPTLRSRCQTFNFCRPSLAEGTEWLRAEGHGTASEFLALAGGAPLSAIAEAERGVVLNRLVDTLADPGDDPLPLAARWEGLLKNEEGLSVADIVTALQKWVFDLACIRFSGAGRFFDPGRRAMVALAEGCAASALIRCYNELLQVRRLATHPLNPRLFLEEIAERYLRALATSRS